MGSMGVLLHALHFHGQIWWSSSAYCNTSSAAAGGGGASSCLLAPALPGPLLDLIEPLLLARLHGLLVNHHPRRVAGAVGLHLLRLLEEALLGKRVVGARARVVIQEALLLLTAAAAGLLADAAGALRQLAAHLQRRVLDEVDDEEAEAGDDHRGNEA